MKKGTTTVGVQRQHTGTAGRIENSQVAVYLTYTGTRGHAVIDRELYLPRSWTEDADRLVAAGVPLGLPTALGRRGREGPTPLRLGLDAAHVTGPRR